MKLCCNPSFSQSFDKMPVPAWLQHMLCSWMHTACFRFSGGFVVQQSCCREQYSVRLTRFVITRSCTVFTELPKAVLALHCNTIGNWATQLPGLSPTDLDTHHQGFLYAPQDTLRLDLQPGTYESIHFDMDPILIDELMGTHWEILPLIEAYLHQRKTGMLLPAVPMDAAVYRLLTNMRNSHAEGEDLDALLINTIASLLFRYKCALSESNTPAAGNAVAPVFR
ncbi:hypothetical protein MKQ68_18460 [Chitinophaga horti]|uniref:AraC family transcriptional regulator n=1 Tax=Chitinophaga horti TaxID=2920382 RepID=A0ABY6IXG7_9BACT|nr:hypothetical protein [Chitinophaga horti]UYQ92073.1 hypothetical protein MKQ68_18460 [Chitinophaga horti]